MRNVIALVLGGGQGTRLYPLTKVRSKPAVPVAGKYRLIDIPISNCINSGLNRIYVLTQFNSASLHRHIRSTYIFDAFDHGFVEILAAQQTLDNQDKRLVPGHRRRRAAELAKHRAAGHRSRAHPFRRPALSHGLPPDAGDAPAEQGRCDDLRLADRRQRGLGDGDHARRRLGAGRRLPGEAEDPARTRTRADRPRVDRFPGRAEQGPQLPGQHGHLPVQPQDPRRRPGKDPLSRFRQGGLSGFHADAPRAVPLVRQLLGGHRHDQVVLRGEPAVGRGERRLRSLGARGPDLHAGAVPAPDAVRSGQRSAAASWPTGAASRRERSWRTALSDCGA